MDSRKHFEHSMRVRADSPDPPDPALTLDSGSGGAAEGPDKVDDGLPRTGPSAEAPRIRSGRAVTSDGTVHRLRIAMPSSQTARLYGLIRNQNARVWCTCLDQKHPERQIVDPREVEDAGLLPSGVYDPRLLGDFDWLGIVDVRVPGAALDLFRAHLRAHEERTAHA